MAGWFPPRVRNWQKINRVKLKRDLKSGKRCHTCFCKIGYKLGKKNRAFEPRRVTIMKSNFSKLLTTKILSLHRDIFAFQEEYFHRFVNLKEFYICSKDLVIIRKALKNEKFEPDDLFSRFLEYCIVQGLKMYILCSLHM